MSASENLSSAFPAFSKNGISLKIRAQGEATSPRFGRLLTPRQWQ
jgi:hypothetical protein